MYENISEIKILRPIVDTDKRVKKIQEELNEYLEEGWILLDISTHAPKELPGGNGSRDNYFCYHLGKLKVADNTSKVKED